jgi:enoyl-CoA hydratase/carnithine racemase
LDSYVEDNILVAKLKNGRTNSITYDDLVQLNSATKIVNQDLEIQGLILTGTGPFYSSGFDLPTFLSFNTVEEAAAFIHLAEEVLLNLFSCTKPVIAALNGHCTAAGMMTAMAADYRIGINNPKIKMGMSEIKIGLPLMPAMNAIVRFGLQTNNLFRDVMFFGRMYSVVEAHGLGMIDEITETNDLLPRAKQLVSEWINTPRRVFTDIKRFHKKQAIQQITTDTKDCDWDMMYQAFFSEDVRNTLIAVQKGMDR